MITQAILWVFIQLANFIVNLFPTMPSTPDSFNDVLNFTKIFVGDASGYLYMVYGAAMIPLVLAGVVLITAIPSWFIVVFIYNKIRGSGS